MHYNNWMSKKQKMTEISLQKSHTITLFFALFLGSVLCFSCYLLYTFQSAWKIIPLVGLVVLGIYCAFIWQLQLKLHIQQQQLLAQQQQTNLILNTIDDGLFLLNPQLQLSEQHSEHITELLNHKKLVGENLIDLLQPLVTSAETNIFRQFGKQLFNPSISDQLLSELNPLIQLDLNPQSDLPKRHLGFQFTRIYEQNNITNILVRLTDLAHINEQQIVNRSDLQTQTLLTIMNTDILAIQAFVNHAQIQLQALIKLLHHDIDTSEVYKQSLLPLSQHAHQLRQLAQAEHLNVFTHLIDEFDEQLNKLKQQHYLKKEDFLPLHPITQHLQQSVQMIKQVYDRLQSEKKSPSIKIQIPEDDFNVDEDEENIALQWQQNLNTLCFKCQKNIHLICDTAAFQNLPLQLIYKLQDWTWYLIQHAATYGIENISEREEKGKDSQGNITVTIEDQGLQYQLMVEDDGQGINYEAIAKHAVDLGWLSEQSDILPNQAQMLSYLFEPEFSILSTIKDKSNEAMGLSQLRQWADSKGGHIHIDTQPHRYTRFTLQLPKQTL